MALLAGAVPRAHLRGRGERALPLPGRAGRDPVAAPPGWVPAVGVSVGFCCAARSVPGKVGASAVHDAFFVPFEGASAQFALAQDNQVDCPPRRTRRAVRLFAAHVAEGYCVEQVKFDIPQVAALLKQVLPRAEEVRAALSVAASHRSFEFFFR